MGCVGCVVRDLGGIIGRQELVIIGRQELVIIGRQELVKVVEELCGSGRVVTCACW